MKPPEKFHESFLRTLIRTAITAALIALIVSFWRLMHIEGIDKFKVFGIVWASIFCVVFGGHWLELFFINYLKFKLPGKISVLYLVRIVYWFLSFIPLTLLANFVFNHLTGILVIDFFGNVMMNIVAVAWGLTVIRNAKAIVNT